MTELFHRAIAQAIVMDQAKKNGFPMLSVAKPHVSKLLDMLYEQGYFIGAVKPGALQERARKSFMGESIILAPAEMMPPFSAKDVTLVTASQAKFPMLEKAVPHMARLWDMMYLEGFYLGHFRPSAQTDAIRGVLDGGKNVALDPRL